MAWWIGKSWVQYETGIIANILEFITTFDGCYISTINNPVDDSGMMIRKFRWLLIKYLIYVVKKIMKKPNGDSVITSVGVT